MSGRIAHRPYNYKTQSILFQAFYSRHKYLPRWTYRRQQSLPEKHPLGYRLSLLPVPYQETRKLLAHS